MNYKRKEKIKTIKELEQLFEKNEFLWDCNISLYFDYNNKKISQKPIDILEILEEINRKDYKKCKFCKIFNI